MDIQYPMKQVGPLYLNLPFKPAFLMFFIVISLKIYKLLLVLILHVFKYLDKILPCKEMEEVFD